MPFLYVDFNQVKSIIKKKNFRANQPYHFISPCSKTATGHYEYAQFKKKNDGKKIKNDNNKTIITQKRTEFLKLG